MAATKVGKNVSIDVKSGKLHIVVDLSKEQGPSKSGKTTVIGTTSGNVQVAGHDGTFVGLNVYKYVGRK